MKWALWVFCYYLYRSKDIHNIAWTLFPFSIWNVNTFNRNLRVIYWCWLNVWRTLSFPRGYNLPYNKNYNNRNYSMVEKSSSFGKRRKFNIQRGLYCALFSFNESTTIDQFSNSILFFCSLIYFSESIQLCALMMRLIVNSCALLSIISLLLLINCWTVASHSPIGKFLGPETIVQLNYYYKIDWTSFHFVRRYRWSVRCDWRQRCFANMCDNG